VADDGRTDEAAAAGDKKTHVMSGPVRVSDSVMAGVTQPGEQAEQLYPLW